MSYFFKIVFASIISSLKTSKVFKAEGANTRKAKDIAGNENYLILCNKCFGNYMK